MVDPAPEAPELDDKPKAVTPKNTKKEQDDIRPDRALSRGPNGETYIYGLTAQAFETQTPKQQIKIRDKWFAAQENLKVFGVPLEVFRDMTPDAQVKIAKLDKRTSRKTWGRRIAITSVFAAAILTADKWMPAIMDLGTGSGVTDAVPPTNNAANHSVFSSGILEPTEATSEHENDFPIPTPLSNF